MATERRLTKIKFDGSKVRIEYQKTRDGGDPDEYALTCADRPAPEFAAALQALTSDVVDICELGMDDASKITVRGVTITHTNDILGACITALKALKTANAPLVLNTPHLPLESYSGEDDGSPLMTDDMENHLLALIGEAERYIDGHRAQGSLFAGDKAA